MTTQPRDRKGRFTHKSWLARLLAEWRRARDAANPVAALLRGE